MQDVSQMLKDMNLDVDKIQEIVAAAQGNPFGALSKMQELGISMETFQQLMGAVMANPQGFLDLARQAGVSDEALSSAKDVLKRFT
jgi:hypothetical protein